MPRAVLLGGTQPLEKNVMRTMSKTSSWPAQDATPPFRALVLQLVAAVLRSASDALTRYAESASERAEARSAAPVGTMEFHPLYRDSGAPEGAIYVNGELVGVIPGLTRL
jgi:hypothetical protein